MVMSISGFYGHFQYTDLGGSQLADIVVVMSTRD